MGRCPNHHRHGRGCDHWPDRNLRVHLYQQFFAGLSRRQRAGISESRDLDNGGISCQPDLWPVLPLCTGPSAREMALAVDWIGCGDLAVAGDYHWLWLLRGQCQRL